MPGRHPTEIQDLRSQTTTVGTNVLCCDVVRGDRTEERRRGAIPLRGWGGLGGLAADVATAPYTVRRVYIQQW